jgi:hypothetical protein
MVEIAELLAAVSAGVLGLTWLGYPLWLWARAEARPRLLPQRMRAGRPSVTLLVVVRNAEARLRELLHNLLALAYPAERRRILVVSDGSDDFTDAVAGSLAHRGVELLRIVNPVGHPRAERIAQHYLESDVVVVVRPEVRLASSALAALVAPFVDPTVGVAFGQEVTTAGSARGDDGRATPYRRFEAWLRDLETRVFGTVSARGSLYAVRGSIYRASELTWTSPDFTLALEARECGCRSVYVPEARFTVWRDGSPGGVYARVVRAVAQEVAALAARPHLLNPLRYGAFAWMLLGHKVGRWLTPWALLAGLASLLGLAPTTTWAAGLVAALAAVELASALACLTPARTALARAAALPGRLTAAAVAIAHAGLKAVRAAALRAQPTAA